MSLFQSSMFGSAVLDLVNRLAVTKSWEENQSHALSLTLGLWLDTKSFALNQCTPRLEKIKTEKEKHIKNESLAVHSCQNSLVETNLEEATDMQEEPLAQPLEITAALRQDYVYTAMHNLTPHEAWFLEMICQSRLKHLKLMKKLKLNLESEVQLVNAFVITLLFKTFVCYFLFKELVEEDDVGAWILPLKGKKFECLRNDRAQSSEWSDQVPKQTKRISYV